MPSVGAPELLVILIVALLVFGPARLPELARGLGNGLRQLREGMTSIANGVESATSIVDPETIDPKAISDPPRPEKAENSPSVVHRSLPNEGN
jgi:sec-independent protein translocase protein TatA